MAYAAFAVSVFALLFTAGNFWWLHARRGSLTAPAPSAYAFARRQDGLLRLRLPLAFFNTGAQALLVADLRLIVDGEPSCALEWITTRAKLRPESDDGFLFATPFAVQGRATKELIAEFGMNSGLGHRPRGAVIGSGFKR